MEHPKKSSSYFVIDRKQLQLIIGILGVSLPLVLIISNSLYQGIAVEVLSSISSYYYSPVKHIYGGIIFTIAIFLYSYRGYSRDVEYKDDCPKYLCRINIPDNIAGNIACTFAVLLVLFPTSIVPGDSNYISRLHFVFAAGFFLTLIYFSLCLFTRGSPDNKTEQKILRNKIYKTCAAIMFICIVTIGIIKLDWIEKYPELKSWLENYDYVFWLESLALWTFGISWFVKAETVFKDKD